MGKLTILCVVLVTLLAVLQFGAETSAAPAPIPQSSCQTGNYDMQYAQPIYYSYSYAQPTYAYSQPQATYTYAPPQYQYQPTYSQPQTPYIPPALPGEFEGLYSTNAIVGNDNIQFTGFEILSNVNAPTNVLSITDVLD